MPTPRDDPKILEEWQQQWLYRRKRLEFATWDEQVGLVHRETERTAFSILCQELARGYNCHPRTVRAYLDPSFRTKERARKRSFAKNKYLTLKEKRAHYFSDLSLNPVKYLIRVFEGETRASLQIIVDRLQPVCSGVRLPLKTVERVLRQYQAAQREGRIRGPPYLEEISPGVWCYSQSEAP